MILVSSLLFACLGESSDPGPSQEPEPAVQPGGRPTVQPVVPGRIPNPTVVDGRADGGLDDPAAKIDQGWRRLPTSGVTAPEWPLALLDPTMCDDMQDGGPVEDGCVTADLKCGDNIIGHTVGGVDRYDTTFYEKKFCWPSTLQHDAGNERVYRLTMPDGEWRAWVTLYSPCEDLNVAAMRFDDDTCPTIDSMIKVCEMSVKKSTITDRIELTTQTPSSYEPTWYVVVEGPDDKDGPFSLHVQCAPGVGGAIDESRLIGGVPSR